MTSTPTQATRLTSDNPPQTIAPLDRAAQIIVAIGVPVVIAMLAVRVVMSPLFLSFEYTRPDFPRDPYGFTTEDRLRYGQLGIDYLVYDLPLDFLGDQVLADGRPMFNARELRHMDDVQAITRIAFWVAAGTALLSVSALAILWRSSSTRRRAWRSLRVGSVIAIGAIGVIAIGAALFWETFFVLFHELLFEPDTWYFPTSDTLIRLYPEQFWFDAALTIGGITLIISLALMITSTLVLKPVKID